MKQKAFISEEDIDDLVQKFAKLSHPGVRYLEQAAILSGGDIDSAHDVFDLLRWVVIDAPNPQGKDTDYIRLGENLFCALSVLINTPVKNRNTIELHTGSLILSIEPFCCKIFALLEPSRFETFKDNKKGLGTIIKELQNFGLIPYKLKKTNAEFEQTVGWDSYNSYDNAVRDIMPARLDTAHRATAKSSTLWESAAVFIVGIIDQNKEKLFNLKSQFTSAGRICTPLPYREQAPYGIPKHRRIDPESPEPRTTRRQLAKCLGNTIEASANIGGKILVLVSPPGWGKSMLLATALDGIKRPMHIVDLTDCSSNLALAQSLLTGLRISIDEIEKVDKSPMYSVRLLTNWLVSPGIVVFENLHRSIHATPPPELGIYVSALLTCGHFIVLEAWTPQLDWFDQFTSGQIATCEQKDIPPLETDEIDKWGAKFLKRDLKSKEASALRLFKGHPLAIRKALETLKTNIDGIGADVDSQFLEMCLDWESLYKDVESFIRHQPKSIRDELIINNQIATWCAVLPWACPTLDMLPTSIQHTTRRLLRVGFITVDVQRCHTSAWARILGLRRIMEGPQQISDCMEWLKQIVTSVPVDDIEQQRRHLACLAARLTPLAHKPLVALLNMLESPEPSYVMALSDMLVAYEAPPDITTITSALEFMAMENTCEQPTTNVPSHTSNKHISMPPDVQFWFLEAAGRLNDYNIVAGQLRTISSGRDPLAQEQLNSSWMAVKAVHQTIMRLTISPLKKLPLYETACLLLPEDITSSPVGYRAWMVRLLSTASMCAFAARHRETANNWLNKATAIHNLIPRSHSGSFTNALHDDATYRIAAGRTVEAATLGELLEAHKLAIAAIPQITDWSPNSSTKWARRKMYHLRVLCHTDNAYFRNQMLSTLRQLPFDSQCLYEIDHLLQNQAEDKVFIEKLRKLAHHRMDGINITTSYGITLKRLSLLILEPDSYRNDSLAWAIDIIERLKEAYQEDWAFLFQFITVLSRDVLNRKASKRLFLIAENIIDVLRPLLPQYSDDVMVQRLYARCLSTLSRNHLSNANIDPDEMNPTKEMSNLKVAILRIDKLYSDHIVDGTSPWIWDDWAEWKIQCTRRKYALERIKDSKAINITRVLEAFSKECDKALGSNHIVAHAVAVRIYRYLWDMDTVRKRVQSLVEESTDFRNRLRIVKIVVNALSSLALTPPLLKMDYELIEVHDRDILVNALDEQLTVYDSESVRIWGDLTRQSLRITTDIDFWERIVKEARNIFGNPNEYWHQICVRLESMNVPTTHYVIHHLTDLEGLVMAGRLFRFGAGNVNIPTFLRHSLSELAVAASLDADAWNRSLIGKRDILSHWYVGISIGLGLVAASPECTLFGTSESQDVDKKGRHLTWVELMNKELSIAYTGAVGHYRDYSREVWNRLRILTGGKPLRILK